MIRLDSTPEHHPEVQCSTFLDKLIRCAPNSSTACISGKRKASQLLISHLIPSIQEWIEPVQKDQDGKESYESLKTRFLGTVNVSRRVAHVEQMKKNLSCTDEKRGNFNQFLQKLSKMFLIFKDEKEPIAEESQC